jgi:hypothetical protein
MEARTAEAGAVEAAPRARARWRARLGMVAAVVVGWAFILIQNKLALSAPVLFVALGYFAGVAGVYTLYRMGAAAATAGDEDPEDADSWSRPVGERGELEREKRALLKAIKEAEFDLEMGKLSKVDAEAMIASYRAQAIAVIKELDRELGEAATVREEIDREVRARLAVVRGKQAGATTASKRSKQRRGRGAAEAASAIAVAAAPVEPIAATAASASAAVPAIAPSPDRAGETSPGPDDPSPPAADVAAASAGDLGPAADLAVAGSAPHAASTPEAEARP